MKGLKGISEAQGERDELSRRTTDASTALKDSLSMESGLQPPVGLGRWTSSARLTEGARKPTKRCTSKAYQNISCTQAEKASMKQSFQPLGPGRKLPSWSMRAACSARVVRPTRSDRVSSQPPERNTLRLVSETLAFQSSATMNRNPKP